MMRAFPPTMLLTLGALLVLSFSASSCGKKSSSSTTAGGSQAPGTEKLQPRPVPADGKRERAAAAKDPDPQPEPVIDRAKVAAETDAFVALIAKRKALLDQREKELQEGRTAELPGAVEMERQLAEMRAELGQYLGTDADKMLKNVFHLHNLVIDMDRDLDKAAADLERMNRGPVQAK
jgi:hypothetical protein